MARIILNNFIPMTVQNADGVLLEIETPELTHNLAKNWIQPMANSQKMC